MGVEPASVCASVRLCVRASTLSNMNISATSRPIAAKFYLKHHLDGGKDALGFGQNRIGTLASMATGSPHRVIMGKISSAIIFDRIFFILAGNENNYNISNKFIFRPDSTKDCGVSCP